MSSKKSSSKSKIIPSIIKKQRKTDIYPKFHKEEKKELLRKLEKEDIMIYDNEGKSIDRYTIILGEDVYSMSSNPFHPHGFNQFCCKISELRKNREALGKEISLEDLSEDILKAIYKRFPDYQKLWGLEHVNFSDLEEFKSVLKENKLTEFKKLIKPNGNKIFVWYSQDGWLRMITEYNPLTGISGLTGDKKNKGYAGRIGIESYADDEKWAIQDRDILISSIMDHSMNNNKGGYAEDPGIEESYV